VDHTPVPYFASGNQKTKIMRYFSFMLLTIITFSVTSCQTNSQNQKKEETMSLENVADTTVAACKLTDKEQVKRAQKLRKELFAKVQDVKELEDGYGLKLPKNNDMMDKINKHIKIEKECCPFFEFEITIKPDEGPIWLKFKGGKQVKEMLRADVEELKKAI